MKKRLTILALALIALSGCSPKIEPEHDRLEREKLTQELKASLLKPSENRLRLIAIKHGAPEDTVEKIVVTYLENHDSGYRVLKQSFEGKETNNKIIRSSSITDTVHELSKSTGIDAKVIASMIIDYESWAEASQSY